MYYYNTPILGMHFFWWFFWILLWIVFFSTMRPVRRDHWRKMCETPLDILKRRLASGEITEQEYESRRVLIDGGRSQDSLKAK